MKILLMLILAFGGSILTLCAQTPYSIKGMTIDTALKLKLSNASISILNAKDSILYKFIWTAEDGSFSLGNIPEGKYILLASYPKYADYVESFTVNAVQKNHDFGIINMQSNGNLLKEVIIKGEVTAIKINGDTTEFNAKAYVIQPNDKVEDLLKQLPGIQVDNNGRITAQGKRVTKVLLDGEEFFGDDPTLVTKNIRADMVDKVQLFDKKSDQAAFTGIDDGKTTKTINVILKEDKKKGVFGKVDVGADDRDYYQGQAFYNKFKNKEKYAAYMTLANTGKSGLGINDESRLGASDNVQIGDNGLVMYNNNSDELGSYNGTYDGKGNPLARTGGLHYDSKWDSDKESINSNYKIGSIETTGTNTILTQQNLTNNIINTNSNQNYDNYAFRQKLDATYEKNLNSTSNLKIIISGVETNFRINNDFHNIGNNNDGIILNQETRSINNKGDGKIFNSNILYTKKFKTARRTFSWNIVQNYNQTNSNGYLNSEVDFYNNLGIQDGSQKTNQYKTTNSISSVVASNMTYTEPISKSISAIFNYGLGISNNTADRASYDQSASGAYDLINLLYTNNYKFNQVTNQFGAILNFTSDKTTLNFGTKLSKVNFKQINEYTGGIYKRDFINLTPQLNYRYKLAQGKSLSITYNGNSIQPTIDQLQPVTVNTDPLNVTLGNPDLRPFFNNSFDMNYNSYQNSSGRSISVSGNYLFTVNAIVNNTTTDAASGKTTIQYINLNGKSPYSYYFGTNINNKIKPLDLTIYFNLRTNGNVYYSYVNSVLNRSKSNIYSGLVGVTKSKQKAYTFSVTTGPTYTINEFSLQKQNNNNARGFNLSGSTTIYLPEKFQFSSNIDYSFTGKTSVFNAQKRTLLNASFGKTFLKDNNLKFSISGNDLLNQNLGFYRDVFENTITQKSFTTIKRYFMFSITWDFTKFGTTAVPVKN